MKPSASEVRHPVKKAVTYLNPYQGLKSRSHYTPLPLFLCTQSLLCIRSTKIKSFKLKKHQNPFPHTNIITRNPDIRRLGALF
ncbi:hypothetical protein [Microcoleus sp. herbarium12]|uniref:hypothetical protein n=1 Tax=Microcoleus sp. herbarium12 TaxID=3055437 RepID=UPI002FD28807